MTRDGDVVPFFARASDAFRRDLRETLQNPAQNLLAGLTVAVVALPLALAFGRTAFGDVYGPAAGLWGAILAGFLAAALGGSAYSVTGPTGVLAIFTADLIVAHGGFGSSDAIAFGFAAVVLSGVVQIVLGAARMGRVIEFIPYPVITGFMSGIALLIVWTGIKDVLDPTGATLTHAQGLTELARFGTGQGTAAVYGAAALAVGAVALTFGWPRLAKRLPDNRAGRTLRNVPGSLLALVLVTVVALAAPFAADVNRIHALPAGGPRVFTDWAFWVRHPEWTRDLVAGAIGLALISSIDTLLTCVIADSVTGKRHGSNRELVAQGVANAVAGSFSGTQNCGAAVRTMVNIRNGGRTRLSGASHALFLVIFLFALRDVVTAIPVAALSGILVVTGVGMVEWHAIFTAHKAPKSDTFVMLTTIVLTLWLGLVEAVFIGVVLAALLFIKRMTELTDFVVEAADTEEGRKWLGLGPSVAVYRINGPLFFGAANRFAQTMQRGSLDTMRVLVFKMHAVTAVDETGMRTFGLMLDRFERSGVQVFVVGLPDGSFRKMERFGLVERVGRGRFFRTTTEGLAAAQSTLHAAASRAGNR